MKRVFFFIYEWPQRVPETGGIVGRTGGRGSHTVIDCHDLWPTLGMGTQLPWGLVAIQEPLSHSLLLVYSSACSFQTQEFSRIPGQGLEPGCTRVDTGFLRGALWPWERHLNQNWRNPTEVYWSWTQIRVTAVETAECQHSLRLIIKTPGLIKTAFDGATQGFIDWAPER